MAITISILVVLLIVSAFFSGSETSIISLSPAKVRSLNPKKYKSAPILQALKNDPHRLLITILIGNNLANIGASVIAAMLFTDLFGSSGLGIATGVMTLFVLVFGEITPKSIATKYAVQISLASAMPLLVLQKIFTPIIWFLDKIVKFLMKRLKSNVREERVSEEEIKALIDISAEEGAIEKREKELLKNVLKFNDIHVDEVMTPRISIDAISIESTLQDVIDFVIKKSHSRIPVYKGTIDNIIGIITIKDVLKLSEAYNANKKLENIELVIPMKVPVSKEIDVLFREFQKARTHIAIVIDEYGGTAGLVTLEDLLEEIVGEIVDESDIEEIPIEVVSEFEINVHGTTNIRDINDYLGIKVDQDEGETISSFILYNLRRFPKEGEEINLPHAKLTVLKMQKNKILRVKIDKK